MKSFYEMMQILDGNRKADHIIEIGLFPDPFEMFSDSEVILGEDEDEPFSAVVDIEEGGHWAFGRGGSYGLYVRGYVLTGEENPASEPFQDPPGPRHSGGVEFGNPGRRLENIHSPLKEKVSKWLDDSVERYMWWKVYDR